MDHTPSSGVAAALAETLHPHFSAVPPVSAVRAVWALGRCGHAAVPLVEHIRDELRRLSAQFTGSGGAPLPTVDRRAAAAFVTGTPWALAAVSSAMPQSLAASSAALAANLAAAQPALLRGSPVAHVSSFLWGLSTVRPAVSRDVLRRLFAVLVAKVVPEPGSPASPPLQPRGSAGLPPHSTRVSFTAGAAASAAAGAGGADAVPVAPSLAPLDCVNVLVAAARFKFYNGPLLRRTVEQLAAADGGALRTLTLARLTDLADALGGLRIYNGCAPVTTRCVLSARTRRHDAA